MKAKLIVTFNHLSESDFLAKSGSIILSLTGNVHYPEPWIAQAPTLAQLNAAFSAYQNSYHASLSRDVHKIAQRKIDRQALIDLLKQLAPYLEMTAQGDAGILATTGYDLHKDIVRGGSTLLPAPSDFRVTHGLKSGTLNIHVARLPGAGGYEIQTALGDQSIEDNWQHALSTVTCRNIQLEGLKPAQAYWVRLRGINSFGAGVWTEPVSMIVV